MTHKAHLLAILFIVIGFFSPALADSVEISGCESCFGAILTLSVEGSGGVYTATLTVDLTNFNDTSTKSIHHIQAVDVKVQPQDTISLVGLKSSPGDPGSDWSTNGASLSNGGCGKNDAGFFCSEQTDGAPTVALVPTADGSNTYIWIWEFTSSSEPTLPDGDFHIGLKWQNEGNTLNGLVISEYSVPEPVSIILLGVGLLGLSIVRKTYV